MKCCKDIEAAYERVKENYRVPDCKKCGTTRINFSWTRKDVIAMAKEVGGFETVVQTGYYAPMTETHSTMGAVIRRARFDKTDNSFWYEYGVKPSYEVTTLVTAHFLLLKMLDRFQARFKLGKLEGPLAQCSTDFEKIWKRKPSDKITQAVD
jgi:ribosomal protein S16